MSKSSLNRAIDRQAQARRRMGYIDVIPTRRRGERSIEQAASDGQLHPLPALWTEIAWSIDGTADTAGAGGCAWGLSATGHGDFGGFIGAGNNNDAEMAALLAAVSYARSIGRREIIVLSDSMTVCGRLLLPRGGGPQRIVLLQKEVLRWAYFREASRDDRRLRVVLRHSKRSAVARAHRLAGAAFDGLAAPPAWFPIEVLSQATRKLFKARHEKLRKLEAEERAALDRAWGRP